MFLRNTFLYFLFIVCFSLANNKAFAQRSSLSIQLYSSPREEVAPYPRGDWWKTPIDVLTFTDARIGNPQLVGDNLLRGISIYSRNSVPAFTNTMFNNYFKKYGGINSSGSNLKLTGEVLLFFIKEENLYSSEVKIRFVITNKEGVKLWSGVKGGSAHVFGIALKEVNYNEAFSDALQDTFVSLFEDEDFINAWSGKITPNTIAVSSVSVDTLKVQLIKLIKGGFDEQTLLLYVQQRSISTILVADQMIEWNQAGIPKSVINEVITINKEASK